MKKSTTTTVRTSDPTIRGSVFYLRGWWQWRVQQQIDTYNIETVNSGQADTYPEALRLTYVAINSFFGDYIDPRTGKGVVDIWTE